MDTVARRTGAILVTLLVGWSMAACSSPIDYENASPAKWRLAPDDVIDPQDTSFEGLVHEVACSSRRPIDDKLLPPVIDYDEHQIVVTLYLEPLPSGEQECPGNSETLFTISLKEPIGSRALCDGYLPPTPDTRPPIECDLILPR
jgi:hypothetical protein